MKKSILLFLILFASGAYAQDWENHWPDAAAKAKQNKQNIVLVFSGSDWCAPCIKLDRNIWQSDTFKAYAKAHWVLYRADFPRKKSNQLPESQVAENKNLAERYNQKGYFPLVVLLDPNGEVLGRAGYEKDSPEAYIDRLKSLEN